MSTIVNSKANSLEEKVKLPPTETISRCYQQGNRKVIRILTVAVYVLCVSLAAIMLSLYYIFIWDPTIRPFVTKANNCDKIVIPEKIAIRLLNSSEVTAEQFYKDILDRYRLLNQLQQQRQQFLQKQHMQLQQLAAANKFQEIFATATIIQANRNDLLKKPIAPTNGTFLLDPATAAASVSAVAASGAVGVAARADVVAVGQVPILDTSPPQAVVIPTQQQKQLQQQQLHFKRKQHRKHSSHHRHNAPRKLHNNNGSNNNHSNKKLALNEAMAQQQLAVEAPLNPPTAVVVAEPFVNTPMPIPLILNSNEDEKRPYDKKSSAAIARRRTTAAYEPPSYLNPFLTGELIFEK